MKSIKSQTVIYMIIDTLEVRIPLSLPKILISIYLNFILITLPLLNLKI
jgi:hypothetical protein